MRYHVPMPLRWSDLDAYNHVNNARFFSLLEEARVKAFWRGGDDEHRPMGIVDAGAAGGDTLTLIARQEAEYLAPIPYQPQPIDIQLWIGKIGAASAEVCYEVWSPVTGDADDETGRTKYAVAMTTIVFLDAATNRPRRITADERAAWAPYLGAPVAFRGGRG